MQITRLELENIKSFEEASVEFAGGINAIFGENGAGKSTLLEAIGFTLFGFNPMGKQEELLRNGASAGSIAVTFLADDDCEYQVVRRLGTRSACYVVDPSLDLKLAEGVTDVATWVCRRLGVPADTDLPGLFSDAIGVPQGLLTAIFLEAPGPRHTKFDRLLRMDEYGKAKTNLAATESHLGKLLNALGNQITALETRAERRPALEQELATLESELHRDEERRAALSAELEAGRSRLEAWAAQKARLIELDGRLSLLGERAEGLRRQIREAERRVQEAQQAALDLERAAPGHEAYLAAQQALHELELARQARERIQAERHEVQRRLDTISQRISANRSKLEEIAAAEKRLQELEPALQQQVALETARDEARAQATRLSECQRAIEREAGQMRALDAEVKTLDERLAQVAARRADAERQPALKAELDGILDAIGRARADLEQARTSREAVAGGLCPFLNAACRNMAEGVSLTAFFDTQIDAGQRALLDLDWRRKAVESGLRVADEAATLVANLGDLEMQRRRRMDGRDETACRLKEYEAEIAVLSDAAERMATLQTQLSQLGDQRPAYAVAQSVAAKRAVVMAALAADTTGSERVEAAMIELDQQLAEFSGLDAKIDARRTEMRQHEAHFQLYLRSESAAASLPGCQNELAQGRAGLEQNEAETREVSAERERSRAGYDVAAHAALEEGVRQAQAELAGLDERLRLNAARRTAVLQEREQLQAVEAELELQRRRFSDDEELLKFTAQTRKWIGDAGPHVTRALVQEISRQAGQIYCEVMHDYSLHLKWDEHYGIGVEKGGYKREFRQLSGGEQMAAAIAVRLALLKQISRVDIAFFDEPTANLDETRRASLADQIVSVQGFSQIFVISHDDTFERVTDHIVRVTKVADVSRAEVE